MKVARSGYYRYVVQVANHKKSDFQLKRLIFEIKLIHRQTKQSYGSRRMTFVLRKKGFKIGRYRVRSLMRKYGIQCKQRRRYRVTTMSEHKLPIAQNKLNRNFTVLAPNKVWTADITFLWTLEGWLYIAVVIDLFSRRVVGWSAADHMRSELIANALKMAVSRRGSVNGLMHHSDRGSQYASHDYQALLKRLGIISSMSRKGNCWDNAVTERFFGSLKSERTDGVRYLTLRQAKDDVVEYVEMYYNNSRLHSTLGYLSPAEFERHN